MAFDIYPIAGIAEPVSSWSHLCAAGVFLVSSIFVLSRRSRSPRQQISIAIFALSSVFLLTISGVYHLLSMTGEARPILQRLDHASIYVMIAGTFTAVHNTFFSGPARWGTIAAVWLLAVAGITTSVVFFNSTPELLDLTIFLWLGWLGAVSGTVLCAHYGFLFIKPLLYGGLAYTGGAILEFCRVPSLIPGWFGPHEAFHVAVLAGLAFHWQFVRHSLDEVSALK